MRRWRDLIVAAAFGVAAACGGGDTDGGRGNDGGSGGSATEAPECTDQDDCAFDEICIADRCAQLCTRHEECRFGEHCIEAPTGARICGTLEPADECEQDVECRGDEICVLGNCIPDSTVEGCLSIADCYIAGAYCGEVDGGTACVDMSCGAPDNACERCTLGPNGGAAETGGPILFAPVQNGACWQDANRCLPGVAPWVCSFSFLAYDPSGDLPTEDLGLMTRFVGPTGEKISTFGNGRTDAAGYDQFFFQACFPDLGGGKIEGAVFLVDDSLRASQTLCLEGTIE